MRKRTWNGGPPGQPVGQQKYVRFAVIISKNAVVAQVLNERARRLWAATESLALG